MNQSMNDEAVYRRAPATPGLLIIHRYSGSECKFTFTEISFKKIVSHMLI